MERCGSGEDGAAALPSQGNEVMFSPVIRKTGEIRDFAAEKPVLRKCVCVSPWAAAAGGPPGEMGEPYTVGFVLMGGRGATHCWGTIVDETGEIRDFAAEKPVLRNCVCVRPWDAAHHDSCAGLRTSAR